MVQHAAMSAFTDNVINVVIGIVGSLISLWLLFCIKPSLRLTLEVGSPGKQWWKGTEPLGRKVRKEAGDWVWCSSDGLKKGTPKQQGACEKGHQQVHYRLEIENIGLAKVLEVECRLKLIRKNLTLGTRESVAAEPEVPGGPPQKPAEPEELLELSGKWSEARRDKDERQSHTGDRYFHWVLPCGVSPNELKNNDYYLLQVWSRHGFTNFGRVHKLRLRRNESGDDFKRFTVEDPDSRRRRRPTVARLASFIADPFDAPYVLTADKTPHGDSKTSGGDSTTPPQTREDPVPDGTSGP
jgi:hypothetical protein